MHIDIICLTCGKTYRRLIEYECELELYAFDFCGVCRKKMMDNFEKQFLKKLLRYEEDGA